MSFGFVWLFVGLGGWFVFLFWLVAWVLFLGNLVLPKLYFLLLKTIHKIFNQFRDWHYWRLKRKHEQEHSQKPKDISFLKSPICYSLYYKQSETNLIFGKIWGKEATWKLKSQEGEQAENQSHVSSLQGLTSCLAMAKELVSETLTKPMRSCAQIVKLCWQFLDYVYK